MTTDTAQWVTTKAPYRIDLCGGPSDVIEFARENTGYVVSVAINRYATSYVRSTKVDDLSLHSLDFDFEQNFSNKSGDFNLHSLGLSNADPKVQLLLACLLHEKHLAGLEVITKSDFLPKSGLGGSASLAVSLLGAIRLINGRAAIPDELAKAALAVENDILGNTAGGQDQFSAANGGISFFTVEGSVIDRKAVDISPETTDFLSQSFLLCGPFGNHSSGSIIDNVIQRYKDNHSASKSGLEKLRTIARSLPDILKSGDLLSFAQAIDEGWAAQGELSPLIPNEEFKEVVNNGRALGILGAKLSGAGGGGYGAIIVHPEKRAAVVDYLLSLGIQNSSVELDFGGFSVVPPESSPSMDFIRNTPSP